MVRNFKAVLCVCSGFVVATSSTSALAAEAATFAGDFTVPVFEQVDKNGVDLVSGVWRVRTPSISLGEGVDKQERGLQWTGQAWVHLGQPSLWQNNGKYTVMYKGGSYEFNGFGSNFSKRAPIDGTTLSCDTLSAGNGITYCRFTSREGDLVVFSGFYSALSNFGSNFGLSALQYGNVGIQKVDASQVEFGFPQIIRASNYQYFGGSKSWGYQAILYGTPLADVGYNSVNYTIVLGGPDSSIVQRLRINTPNLSASTDHYLRPKGTTQTVTDDFGNIWSYTFDTNRNLTAVTQPGGGATVTATYDSNHKVTSLTTPSGTWTYAYANTLFSNIKTTTVTSPLGEVTTIKYNSDANFVTEVKDPLNRTTLYNWDTNTRRLTSVSYPEGNSVAFEYDARGNVTKKTAISKDGQSSLVWQAAYPLSCPAGGTCNQPTYTIDPKGNRTDYEYTGTAPGPTKVIYPAADAQSPRQTVTNEYSGGRLIRTRSCITQSTCAGTADEVVKEYGYSPIHYYGGSALQALVGNLQVLTSEKVTSGGQSLLTCHQYDLNGHRTMTTPPNANLAVCPASVVPTVLPGTNPPIAGYARSAPTFPGEAVIGGGGGGGGGGVGCGGQVCQ